MEKENLIVQMLEAGLHFGHQKSKRHPKMDPYIFMIRNGVAILDLQKTEEKLKEAMDFAAAIASRSGQILFLGSKRQAQGAVAEAAIQARMPYATKRWLGGTFTNFDVIQKKINRLRTLEREEKADDWKKYTKKERLSLAREKKKLEAIVGGLKSLEKMPQAIFIIDIMTEKNAIAEARKKRVPIIALVDSNSNPELVDYPIPGNDDAIRGIKFICDKISAAIMEGQKSQAVKARGAELKTK
ncbi:MAG: 30S ribosomal protein S2 [bacterium]|nr:30S ribosomal protein S2 [bacterium]